MWSRLWLSRVGKTSPLQLALVQMRLLSAMVEVTQLLQRLNAGEDGVAADLLPLLYQELRTLAAQRLAHEPPGHTLQATALVHEAYVRLVGDPDQPAQWQGRRHFFGAAAEAMRRILVDSARRRQRQKRGGELQRVEWSDRLAVATEVPDDLLALDEALERFAAIDPVSAELVKLRYFAGMTMAEAAAALELAPRTAERQWAFARAWLHRDLSTAGEDS